MSSSKTQIFNMALNELGVAAPIANADAQDDTRAIILRNFYETARDEVLKSFDWNFAEQYRVLSLSTETSLDPRYQYIYDYPNDCLNARDILDAKGLKKKFKPSSIATGQKVLLTTVSPATLRFTSRVDKENYFDAEFSMTLALYLAGLAGVSITGSEQKADKALKKYWDKLRLGQISNASEGVEIDEDDTTYLDAR